MGRPRRGVTEVGGVYTAALPVATGSTRRRQFSCPDAASVHRWLADGERELAAGRPLPDPAGYRPPVAAPAPAPGPAGAARPLSARWWAGPTAAHGHDFTKVAHAWVELRYTTLRQAQPERRKAVLAIIDKDLAPWLTGNGAGVVERIENQLVGLLAGHLAGQQPAAAPEPEPWPELDGRREVTLAAASRLAGASRSSVKRWHRAGQLPGWRIEETDGRVRIPVAELRAARGVTRAAQRRAGLAPSTARNKLAVLRYILDFARANGVPLTGDPMAGITAVAPDPDVAITPQRVTAKHLPLEHSARIAAYLPVVQQLVYWLERILGVRIGEGFGPRVGDVVDFGGDGRGCLVLNRQGGRPFLIRVDGGDERGDAKEQLKTPASVRAIELPRQLMALIRIIIDAFHTDPVTGAVDRTARLIPGLRQADAGGQQAHRAALDRAVAAAGIDQALYGRVTPKSQRAYLITDLKHADVDDVLARRYVGHVAGHDEHDRAYMFDPAGLTPAAMAVWRPVTAALEALIDERLGGTLVVPTAERERFGPAHPIRRRLDHVYAALAAAGWYVEARDDAGEALVDTEQVARALGVAVGTARRQMREGELPGRLVRRGGRGVWVMDPADLDRHLADRRDRPTIEQLSCDLAITDDQLRAMMHRLGVAGEQRCRGGDIRLRPDDVAVLRAEHRRLTELHRVALPLSVAAVELGVPVLLVETLLRRGVLEPSAAPTTARQRYVTRASVMAYRATRTAAAEPVAADEPAVPDEVARAITTLTRPGLAALVTAGVLVPVMRQRRRHITVVSIEAWARGAALTGVLARLDEHRPA